MPHRTDTAPACEREPDPDIFFSTVKYKTDAAKAVCGGCALQAGCLEFAMTFPNEDQWGVWGGMTASERKNLRAALPDQYPVQTPDIAGYLGTRGERFDKYGRRTDAFGPDTSPGVHAPIDWAQVDRDELDDTVVSLMERYGNETFGGYALTGQSGIVLPVNDEVAA